ncbi:MAG TPA: 4,5-DOPA dioxygenase extradiol [Pyrinomonadaceae bacterium]|nr:4,5-DOPA dioxygenase extradiol [Pyrinomonadaceae bacterium]
MSVETGAGASEATTPAIFFGHGNPMNAILTNAYTQGWASVGASLIPRPRAVLSISAHWYLPGGAALTVADRPRTIHDFGGFPRELYEVKYPAPGAPELFERVKDLLAPAPVEADTRWGLDHGTWSVLCHVFPDADVPVVQLRIDETLAPSEHYELARRLAPLREEGVLVLGSGNVVHNLHTYAWGRQAAEPFDWAIRFEQQVRDALTSFDHEPLINYESLGRDARLSIPTPEHYLPLLYVIATRRAGEQVTFPVEGIDGGSVSMLTVRLG